jgi:hypothetical protein
MNTLSGFVCNEHILANMYYQPIQNTDPINAYQYNLGINHRNILENPEDYEYYKRCVDRFRTEFNSPTSKMFVHISPLYTIEDYQHYGNIILQECYDFQNFLESYFYPQATVNGYSSTLPSEKSPNFNSTPFSQNYKEELINFSKQSVKEDSFTVDCEGKSNENQDKVIRSLYFIMLLDNLETSPSITILHEEINNPKYKIYLLKTNHQFIDAGETFMGNYKEEQELIENCIRRFSV